MTTNLPNKIDYLHDGLSFVALVDRMLVDGPLKTVNAARISYNKKKDSFDEKDSKLSNFLWTHEHTSPFRHSYFTFHLKLPLFVARQLMKYQVGSGFRTYEVEGKEVSLEIFDHFYDTDKGCSWNEISGRYTQTSEDFYIPFELRSNPPHGNKQSSEEYNNPLKEDDLEFISQDKALSLMFKSCDDAILLYHQLIKNGVAKEIARMILPQNIYTECYWTCSLQAIIWFLHQRLKPDAQYEIRQLAEGIHELIKTDLDKLGLTKEQL
jgi:thymidylate synthase (FAD)